MAARITRSRRTPPARFAEAEAPPAVRAERELLFATMAPVVEVIGSVVGDNVEIVLHDLTRPESSILKIVHGQVSGRSVGDSILSGPDSDKGFAELRRSLPADRSATPMLISDYRTFTRDGRELQSSTVIFRDSLGTPFASLCINADMSVVVQAHALLQSMLGKRQEPPAAGARKASPGIDVLMQEIIADSVRRFGKPVAAMGREEKIHAVDSMLQRGLFIVKGGVERAASALGVTRFTIYNYLDVLKRRGAEPEPPPGRPPRRPGAA
jgi:predicted transcriptional regulator YheO